MRCDGFSIFPVKEIRSDRHSGHVALFAETIERDILGETRFTLQTDYMRLGHALQTHATVFAF